MKHLRFIIAVFAAGIITGLGSCATAQTVTGSGVTITWSKTTIDSTLNPTCCDKLQTKAVVDKYKPVVDSHRMVIGQCPKGLQRGDIETELGDWTVDVLYDYARNYLDTTGHKDMPLDFAILNFGGMRTEMPKGDVNSLDILSIFPFDNFLVIEELPGKYVKELFTFLSKTRMQPMSHVKFAVKDNQIAELLINGEPLDEKKTYHIATIDFLKNGGDNLVALGHYTNLIESHVKMMDLVLRVIKDLTAQGKVIEKECDGRASWE